MKNNIIFLASILSLLISCGKNNSDDKDYTYVDFTTAAIVSTDFEGGVMIWGVSESGLGTRATEFFSEGYQTADGPLRAVPNGSWKFYGVGFDDYASGTAGMTG